MTFHESIWKVSKQVGIPVVCGVALLWSWSSFLALVLGAFGLLAAAVFCHVGHNYPRGDAAHEHCGFFPGGVVERQRSAGEK